MDDLHMEAYKSLNGEQREGDREREYVKRELQHDEHEPTTYERKTMMESLMGEDYRKFFREEQQAKHLFDANHPL